MVNSYYFYDKSKPVVDTIFTEIRKNGYPKEIKGHKVVRVRDAETGFDSGEKDEKCRLPKTKMITFYFEKWNYSYGTTKP
eukprot:UN11039